MDILQNILQNAETIRGCESLAARGSRAALRSLQDMGVSVANGGSSKPCEMCVRPSGDTEMQKQLRHLKSLRQLSEIEERIRFHKTSETQKVGPETFVSSL